MHEKIYFTTENKRMILISIVLLLTTEIGILEVDLKYKKDWFFYSDTKTNYIFVLFFNIGFALGDTVALNFIK